MSADFKYFPDVFKEVVDSARLSNDPANNLLPYYAYGTYLELLELCKIKDNNQIEKYPLVWLVWDNAENQQKYIEPYLYNITPRVFICSLTRTDFTSDEHYTNTLKAVLYPIFELVMSEMGYHANISLGADFRYMVNDHPFWLNNDAGQLDVLSAIEIKFENVLMIKS
ncbi:MAG: hypothetical protein IMZ64_11830 [Bacteroidetes bacterium]|nr:hypothetical protein [Bacteroidota bacterium]